MVLDLCELVDVEGIFPAPASPNKTGVGRLVGWYH